MARGRGFEFGDAGSDKIALFAVLGVIGYVLLSAGKGLTSALSNLGQGLANTTGIVTSLTDSASKIVAGATNAATDAVGGIQNSGRNFHDLLTGNTPNAVPDPGFGPDPYGPPISPPLEPPPREMQSGDPGYWNPDQW
jgi:hypothetical protein